MYYAFVKWFLGASKVFLVTSKRKESREFSIKNIVGLKRGFYSSPVIFEAFLIFVDP